MENIFSFPPIIQGGMGFNISDWQLARTVSMLGQRGTVSGVSLERVVAEFLRRGDPGGHFRSAFSTFPFPEVAEKVWEAFYLKDGFGKGRGTPFWSINPSNLLISLTILANYSYVWLAKQGHNNPVGINYLEKIATPHVCAITGAMLAGVDFVTMGAGIPLQIPDVLNAILENRTVNYRVPVVGTTITGYTMSFNPKSFFGRALSPMSRPGFIPIIASNLLASIFVKKLPKGSVQGFVIEELTAGGHNAPPKKLILNDRGEPQPIYGEKDIVVYEKIADLGLPFWIGGSYASPEKLKWARSKGAKGIQVGTIFALCEESGLRADIKKLLRKRGFLGSLQVRTDMRISPTGFPFKVAILDGTISDPSVFEVRERVCNQGALLTLYERPDGSIGYRCPSEPVQKYVAKGGCVEDTKGRGCLCNGLYATAGLSDDEPPIVTLGDDVSFLKRLMSSTESSYTAEDVIGYLLS